jgi:hypothetical protein
LWEDGEYEPVALLDLGETPIDLGVNDLSSADASEDDREAMRYSTAYRLVVRRRKA